MDGTARKEPFYNLIEKYLIVVMLIVMTVIISFNIVTRFVFNYTLSWGEQLARFLLVWSSFAGISWCGRIDVHMRVTAIALALKKSPQTFQKIYLLGDIVAICYGFYMSYEIFQVMSLVKAQGQVLSALPIIPKWTMYLAGVLGMAGMSLRIIQRRVVAVKSGNHMEKEGAE